MNYKDHIEFFEIQVIYCTYLEYKSIDHKIYNVIRINLDEIKNENADTECMLSLKKTINIEFSKRLTDKIEMRQSDG